jgi:hypothetical protein
MPISLSWKTSSFVPRYRCLAWLSLILTAFAATPACGQTITVRLMNEAAKSPLVNCEVRVFGITGNRPEPQFGRHPNDESAKADLRLKTDARGTVHFDLPSPPPDHFVVRAVLSQPEWDCYCMIRAVTAETVKSGRLIRSPGGNPKVPGAPAANPSPGEILFSLRPTPWYVRILWPLLKG